MNRLVGLILTCFVLNTLAQFDSKKCARSFKNWTHHYDYVDAGEELNQVHTFYWFYQAKIAQDQKWDKSKLCDAPIIAVLGSQGVSATGFHNFLSSGPFDPYNRMRPYTLADRHHLLYIDCPAGTGFSYVSDDKYLSKTTKQVAKTVKKTMMGFFQKHPEYNSCPVWLYSESLGSRYLPEAARLLLEAMKKHECHGDLRGIIMGSPFVHPAILTKSWGRYLSARGYVDSQGQNELNSIANGIETALRSNDSDDAGRHFYDLEEKTKQLTSDASFCNLLFDCDDDYSLPDPMPEPEPYTKTTASITTPSYLDFSTTSTKMEIGLKKNTLENSKYEMLKCTKQGEIERFMNQIAAMELRCKISSNRRFGNNDLAIIEHLEEDMFKSVVNSIQKLMDVKTIHKKDLTIAVLVGMQDPIVNPKGTMKWIEGMMWKHKARWLKAKYAPITVSDKYMEYLNYDSLSCDEKIGYVKKWAGFMYFNIISAGHHPFRDCPACVKTVIDMVTNQK